MDEPGTLVAPPEPAGDPLPLLLAVGLWVPVFAVVLWFMIRLFTGRWIHEPPETAPPPPLPREQIGVEERHDPRDGGPGPADPLDPGDGPG